ncbi:hypothetical protein SCE1572_05970 [Sorangium cellulosum So0157-2]|uniref:Uncharacterized protein n=1 Tax=Sorangium cellulosum So0157-2 TaxID=1254432 RepID=S4XNE4_SORCE|nr:hypothetical protein [Sorangium cellulosum]AGP34079.1 hypothetical protein SCE1572_05970 [Sorangium cellulosum So0157-2]
MGASPAMARATPSPLTRATPSMPTVTWVGFSSPCTSGAGSVACADASARSTSTPIRSATGSGSPSAPAAETSAPSGSPSTYSETMKTSPSATRASTTESTLGKRTCCAIPASRRMPSAVSGFFVRCR